MRRWPVTWLMARLTALSLVLGLVSVLSYATGAHMAVRYLNPAIGDWWDRNNFLVMEGGASALGILIGLGIGARVVDDGTLRSRSAGLSLVAAAIALVWIVPACAALARMGWNADGFALGTRIMGFAGYSGGLILDKVLVAGVYFLKTAAFALLLGLAWFGAAFAVLLASGQRAALERKPVADG